MNNRDIVINDYKGMKVLQFKKLLDYGINHGYYIGRDRDFRTIDKEREYPENFNNYKEILHAMGEDYHRFIKTIQSHTDNVLVVDSSLLEEKPNLNLSVCKDIDALITKDNSISIGTTAADCVLVYIYDPLNKVIANIHSGWKGTLYNITIKTITIMHDKFNCQYSNLECFINPCIRKHHFEVDDDVYNLFKNKYSDDKYYTKKDSKWLIDLVGIIKDELLKYGVGHITDSNICSYCDKKIHSYRRDKEKYKLSMAFIKLKEE